MLRLKMLRSAMTSDAFERIHSMRMVSLRFLFVRLRLRLRLRLRFLAPNRHQAVVPELPLLFFSFSSAAMSSTDSGGLNKWP
jgi:hypothetical protein